MTHAEASPAGLALRLDGGDWASAADALISVVTNRLHSDVSRRGYRTVLRQFLAWHVAHGGVPTSPSAGPALPRRARRAEARAVDDQPAPERHPLTGRRVRRERPARPTHGGHRLREGRAGARRACRQLADPATAEKLLLAPLNTLMGLRATASSWVC